MTGSREQKDPQDPQTDPKARRDSKTRKRDGWIRWWGLGAFLLVTGALAAVWLLLVDPLAKWTIEQTGTRLVGAKVEVDKADVSLVPLGLTVTGLQVTNPDEPMTNAVEIARMAGTLDGLQLLHRKVIIEEMTMDGLRLGTPRRTSGAIVRAPQTGEKGMMAKVAEKVTLPSFEVPDVKTILAQADLQSVKLVEQVRAEVAAEQENWKKRLAELPNKDKFNDYKTRIEKLKSAGKGGLGGVLGATGEVAAIQKDLERDLAAVRKAKTDFETTLTTLRQRVDQAAKAPQEDLRRLQDKYSLSSQGLANMSGLLLGGKGGEYVQKGLGWYAKLQPMLARSKEQEKGHEVVKPVRGKGLDVRFTERTPLPDFLIRHATVSAQLEIGILGGKIDNITPDQDVLGKPLTFAFAGDSLKALQSVRLDGTLDHVRPEAPKDSLRLSARGYPVHDLVLSDSADWPVTLRKTLADFDVHAAVSGRSLDGDFKADFKSVWLTAGRPDSTNPMAKAIASALSGVSGFSVKADLTGTLDQYDLRLSSDLDRVLKDAAGRFAQDYAQRVGKDLEAAVMAKVEGPLNDLKGSLRGLGGINDELQARVTEATGLSKGAAEKLLPGGFKLPF